MSPHRRFHVYFWIIFAICLIIFAVRGSPAFADLGGSDVTFAPSVEYGTGTISAACFIPRNEYQILCFQADTYTSDGEDVTSLFLKFPSDWWVDGSAPTVASSGCTGGGSFGGTVYWTGFGDGREYILEHDRYQAENDTCSAVYCIEVIPSETLSTDVTVPWSWYSNDTVTAPPHRPCSSDGYYGYTNDPPCDEMINPPATVPICNLEPITILPETLPNALAGHFYTQQLSPTNTDISNPDYTWQTSGGMPSGFSIPYNTGKIEWSNPTVGTYNFTVYVEGPGWSEGSRAYTIVVDPELIFDPGSLPYARQYTAYNQAITVSAGTAPYTLSHTNGTLPPGINFVDPAFTGTPTTPGVYPDIVIQAVDDTGVTQTHTYTLTVFPEHLFSWTPTTPNSGQTTTFTAVEGFEYYDWTYASSPGGECDVQVWNGYSRIANINFYGKGEHKVCLEVTDYTPYYLIMQDDQLVTVLNTPPDIYTFYTYPYPSFPGQAVESSAYFDDPDNEESFTCEIDWGDGSSDTGTYVPYGECVFPPHTYTSTGSYTLEATVIDGDSEFDTYTATHEVVHLYAEPDTFLLASNIHTTTLLLRGYAPQGTTTLQFAVDSPPSQGSLSTPVFKECFELEYIPLTAICEAEIVYTPTETTPPYVGDDQFTFVVEDDSGHTSEPGDVSFWVDDNQAPVVSDSTATVLSAEPSDFNIFTFDEDFYNYTVDDITFHLDTQPQHGTLTFTGHPNSNYVYDPGWNVIGVDWSQLLTYTPDPGSTASTDSFTFHVNDTHQDSGIATVTLELYTPKTLHVNVNDDVVDPVGCDETHCSLREAVSDALIGDTIDFTLSLPNTITLTWDGGGELLINKYIKILGPGADQLTVSAGFLDPALPEHPSNGFRVFHIYNDDDPVKASIFGLTIRDGRGFEGGGVFVDENAELALTNCQIGPNNIVEFAGGGISTDEAVLTMTNCTVIDNHGTGSQGGAGMFIDDSEVTITNSTFTGNITNNLGGGILAQVFSDVTLIHSTVSGNTANQDYADYSEGGGGGIYVDELSDLTLWNTIVAGNSDLTDPSDHAKWPDFFGEVTSMGGNLIGDETGSSGWLPGDMVGTSAAPIDPVLGVLDVHEPGSTPTFPLLEGSPAIDAVGCAPGVTKDQRGVRRPQGIACDIGAFELENPLTYLFLPLILR